MAIRKPFEIGAKSAAMAEMMKNVGFGVTFKTGSVVEGTVSTVKGDEVFTDIGYKSEGVVHLDEFEDPTVVVPGYKFPVMLLELENDRTGMMRLSKTAADRKIRWQKILSRYTEGCIVTGTVKSALRGGCLVDVDGVEAFMPMGQVDVSPIINKDLTPYVGQTYEMQVIKISEERQNLIVSRRELLLGKMAEKKAELLAVLQKGEIRKGRVKNITDFGAFIDLDGLDGLLHITDMSWGRVKHPSELLKVGQELDVMVLDVDKERERVSLGLKQCTENPWSTIADQYPVGKNCKGKVVNLVTYGAFVEIAPGIEGLVHISEFSWTKHVVRASDMLQPGDEVDVQILAIDTENQKISLGIRQTQQNPWTSVAERYLVGKKVKGRVRNFTNYGAFVQLEDGIDGMIHVSDMSWTRKINHPTECLQKGQEVEAVILDVNAQEQRISLGFKQAQPDPWSEIAAKYQVGTIVKGKVSKTASFGAFVELEDGVDGLVHISQIADERVEKVKDKLVVGQEVEARVMKVDRGERRIGLSIRAVNMSEEEVKALEEEIQSTAATPTEPTDAASFGGLAGAFDEAFQSAVWQPGEVESK